MCIGCAWPPRFQEHDVPLPRIHARQFSEWNLPADARLARKQAAARVREAIDRLPERYRTVLMLRDIEELDTAEVAAMLGVTSNAVKVRLHRARQALLTVLDPVIAEGVGAGAGARASGRPARIT